jgi:hypothetical protein
MVFAVVPIRGQNEEEGANACFSHLAAGRLEVVLRSAIALQSPTAHAVMAMTSEGGVESARMTGG